jgi:hypothetical protein
MIVAIVWPSVSRGFYDTGYSGDGKCGLPFDTWTVIAHRRVVGQPLFILCQN